MTSPFTITPTPPTSLKLEAGHEGTFSFTITSLEAPDQTQEVILQALLIGPDEKGKEVDWLVPGPQRTLTVVGGKTETVTIAVRTTATTPRGEHSIKLAIADQTRPNDKFAYSSPVTCEVTTKPVVTKPPTSFPKWLIPVIAGGVVVLGLGIFLIVKLTGGGDDKAGLGKACDGTPNSCEAGLLCAPDVLKCLLPGGAPCEEGSACASNECSSTRHVCAVPLGLACNPADKDLVPCAKPANCDATQKLCLGAVGAPCKTGSQCDTGKCDAGICAIAAPAVKPGDPCETTCPAPLQCSAAKRCVEQVGRPCTANNQCSTGLCENAVCTDPQAQRICTADGICGQDQKCIEIQPGLKRCAWNPGHACSSNADCTSQWCNGGACSRDDGKCDGPADCPAPYLCVLDKHRCLIPNGGSCGGHVDCNSGFCNANRCAPSPCVPACRALFYCNNDINAPKCLSLIITTRPDVILKPTFRIPVNR